MQSPISWRVAGFYDVALEFAANIGKWPLKGFHRIQFNLPGEMTEFQFMIRPIEALLGTEMGTGLTRKCARLGQLAGAPL